MKKEALLIVLFFLILVFSCFAYAEVSIPNELLTFYSHNISSLTLSNDSFILYDKDRTVFYYMYYNGINTTLNITTTISCTSSKCPQSKHILFDYLLSDETLPFVKKAAGIFILTNETELGNYDYTLNVSDISNNFSEQGHFTVSVISSSLWRQFWHNLFDMIGLA